MDKKLGLVALIAIVSLVIAMVALSESFIMMSEFNQSPASSSLTTPQPTLAPD